MRILALGGRAMPIAVAAQHRHAEIESCDQIAASFVDDSEGAVLTINRTLVLTAEQHEVCESWARACLHDGRRFALMSAEDLALLPRLG